MENIVRFNKEDRSSFPYWFAHWCAFQMTALNLGVWKFKYLFHDIEKPWMKLFCTYKTVQKWHNEHSSHHLIHYILNGFADWRAMIIDWECSRFTKQQRPDNAAGEYNRIFSELEDFIKTYRYHDNKTIKYIKDNNLDTYDVATRLKVAYVCLHLEFKILGIEHEYNDDYLNDYFNHVC